MQYKLLMVDDKNYFAGFNPYAKPKFTTNELEAHRFISKDDAEKEGFIQEVSQTLRTFGYKPEVKWLYTLVRSKPTTSLLKEEMIDSLYKFFHRDPLTTEEEKTLTEMMDYVNKNLDIHQ